MPAQLPGHADIVLDAVRSPKSAAVSQLAASWCRSAIHHKLDPEVGTRERIGGAELTARRILQQPLLAVAAPVLDEVFRAVGRSGCGVVLSDAEGVIIDTRIAPADAEAFCRNGLVEGACWSEAEEGTNGIGTCLFEGKPVIIHRDQHFASRNIGISCMDAPIHDPNGRLVAAFDVSSCRVDHGPAMAEMVASLVRDAARRVERDYFCRHFADHRILFLADDATGGTALLAVDRDDLIVGASRGARLRLGLGGTARLDPQPLEMLMGNGLGPSFDDADRTVLRQALACAGGNATAAARLLGIGRATFYRRLRKAGIRN